MTVVVPSTVRELREKGRDRAFLAQVLADEFDRMLLFLEQKSRPELEILDILSTIANVLLVNRELLMSHLPKRARSLLSNVLEIADRDFTELEQAASRSQVHKFKRIAVYRTIFLIMCASDTLLRDLVTRANDLLVETYRTCYDIFEEYSTDDAFLATLNEIVKALIQIANRHLWMELRILYHECVFTLDKLFARIIDTKTEIILAKSLSNMYFLSRYKVFSDAKLKGSIVERRMVSCRNYFVFFKQQLELFEQLDPSTELSDLLTIIALLAVLYRSIRSFYDQEHRTKALEDFHDYFVTLVVPTEGGDNYFYCKIYQLIELSSPTASGLGQDLATALQLKGLVLNWYLSMCSSFLTVPDDTYRLFLRCFGWTNTVTYLVAKDIIIPDSIDRQQYQNPDPSFLNPKYYDLAKKSHGTSLEQVFQKVLIGNQSSKCELPPMTAEEKEQEAEKLFTLLQRVEKNPMFKGFQNPVREWQQLGRFESNSVRQ